MASNKMKKDPIEVGKRINHIRTNVLGLSMSEFGERIDDKVKSGTVANWETGKNLPNNQRLKKIAEIGGYDVDELLYGTIEEYIATNIRKDSAGFHLSEEQFNRVFEAVLNTVEGVGRRMEVVPYDYIDNLIYFSILDETFTIDQAPEPGEREFDNTIDYHEWMVMRLESMVEDFEEIAKDVKQDKLIKSLVYLKAASEKISAIE